MDVPINANVQCSDGPCGRSTYVIVNPTTDEITHLVVREKRFSQHLEREVPVSHILESTPDRILLDCTRAQVDAMSHFIMTDFIKPDLPNYGYHTDQYMMWPYIVPPVDMESKYVTVEHKQIPPGELAVRRGAHVEATDGQIGRVSEFLVNPENGHITHLILEEGHLWGKKDVSIPVSHIKTMAETMVYLDLSKDQVAALPVIHLRQGVR